MHDDLSRLTQTTPASDWRFKLHASVPLLSVLHHMSILKPVCQQPIADTHGQPCTYIIEIWRRILPFLDLVRRDSDACLEPMTTPTS